MRFVTASIRCRICNKNLLAEMVPADSDEEDAAWKRANRHVHNEIQAASEAQGLSVQGQNMLGDLLSSVTELEPNHLSRYPYDRRLVPVIGRGSGTSPPSHQGAG